MRIDLYAVRRARTIKISKSGEWVSVDFLVEKYNGQWGMKRGLNLVPKVVMHKVRMTRILNRMVTEGYYLKDPEKGYFFLTSKPGKR